MSPWLEKAKEDVAYHVSMQKEHGKAKAGKRGKKKGWSLKDTAKKLHISAGGLCESIKVVGSLEIFPEIKEMEKRQEALKFLRLRNGSD